MTDPAARPALPARIRRARTMTWVAALLFVLAGTIGAPEAGVAVALLASLAALVPLLTAGARRWRVAGLLVLLAALALAWSLWPAASLRRGP